MIKICPQCKKEFAADSKKCPDCGKRLKQKYTEEELREIQKQNDDFTVINTLLM